MEIRLWLERCEPPAGTIALGGSSDAERFSGWLGLLRVLDQLFADGSAHAVGETGDELGARGDA